MISIFGHSGFIGTRYCEMYPDQLVKIPRESNDPESSDVLYLISTVDNYNIFTNPFIDIETNLVKLIKVLERCKDKDITFNFISSWFVYGNTEYTVLESDPCNPKGFYSVTKRTAEQLVIEYCTTFKIKYRIIRLSNVIGITDHKVSDKKNILQYTIQLLKQNESVTVYNQGTFTRDYLHVDDVCTAINLIVTQGNVNDIYNVGSGISTRFIDILVIAKQLLRSSSEFLFVGCPDQYKNFQIKNCRLNVTKLTNLGFKPRYNLTGIIEKLCH